MTLLDPAARSEPLTEDQIEIEWMRWNLPADSGDAMAFYRLGEPERIRKAFVDGLLRGAAVVAQSPIPAARLEPIPGGVAETVEAPEDGELEAWRHAAEALLAHDSPPRYELRRAAMLLQNAYLFARKLRASLPSSTPGLDPREFLNTYEPRYTPEQRAELAKLIPDEADRSGMSGLDPIRSSDGEVKGG
jgi:hypothetical protein